MWSVWGLEDIDCLAHAAQISLWGIAFFKSILFAILTSHLMFCSPKYLNQACHTCNEFSLIIAAAVSVTDFSDFYKGNV